MHISSLSFFFFFNDTATTEIYTLSLHDALPICDCLPMPGLIDGYRQAMNGAIAYAGIVQAERSDLVSRYYDRSEEHTSELQSPDHLVCRLLLEKKNIRSKRSTMTMRPHTPPSRF